MSIRVAAASLVLAWSTAASASEVIATAGGAAPPLAAPVPAEAPPATAATEDPHAREIGDWARGVMAGRPSQESDPPERTACAPPPDRKPHGEVWAGVGTGGYRSVGGVVSQPVGDCGRVTLGVSHTEGKFGRRWR